MKLFLRLIVGPAFWPTCFEGLVSLSRLFRLRLATLVAASALCGALLTGQGFNRRVLLSAAAVWLLAAGCSALNQVQEIDVDRRMSRTCQRPLPREALAPVQALLLAAAALALGLLLLLPLGAWPLAFGLLAVVWYNLVYTPLKRKTAWTVFPGAICGALPPLIGYTALGGAVSDPLVVLLAGTLLVWQVPHSWLLSKCYQQDHSAAGLPSLFDQLDDRQVFTLTICWLVALLAAYLCFGFFALIGSPLLSGFYLLALALLTLKVFYQLRRGSRRADSRSLFQLVNISMGLLLLVLSFDSLL